MLLILATGSIGRPNVKVENKRPIAPFPVLLQMALSSARATHVPIVIGGTPVKKGVVTDRPKGATRSQRRATQTIAPRKRGYCLKVREMWCVLWEVAALPVARLRSRLLGRTLRNDILGRCLNSNRSAE